MKLAPLALLLTLTAAAQQPQFTDPANLRGERVKPRDGRELPIDGGDGHNALGLQQLLRKLSTRASILNIVAHPDDEDGGMLTLYARGLGARVADISLTRGEGGQNAMTGDFEDALGLLRTQELLANDRYTGVDQFFGTEVDFGFSKTKSEAFAKWTHDRVLYDVVRAIRLYRPLVLTSTWTGGVTDGHGQHQVSGQITQEAFLAAGDPAIFPELTAEGILPWQPLKVYARVPMQSISDKGLYDYATGQFHPARFTNYVTGEVTTTTPSTDVIVHEGTPDPLLTKSSANVGDLPDSIASLPVSGALSYVQFARIGLGLQKSQIGPGFRAAPAGAFDVAYHLYGSRVCGSPTFPSATGSAPAQSREEAREAAGQCVAPHPAPHGSPLGATFFDDIDTSLEGIASLIAEPAIAADVRTQLALVADSITLATAAFNTKLDPAVAIPDLAKGLLGIDKTIQYVADLASPLPERAQVDDELAVKRVQMNDALVFALGLQLNAEVASSDIPIDKPAGATLKLSEASHEHVVLRRIFNENSDGVSTPETTIDLLEVPEFHLSPSHRIETACASDPARARQLTRPYFFRDNIETPVYKLSEPHFRNAPATSAAITCRAVLSYNQLPLELAAVATHQRQPAAFIPEFSVELLPSAQILPATQDFVHLGEYDKGHGEVASKTLDEPDTWTSEPVTQTSSIAGWSDLRFAVPMANRRQTTLHAVVTLKDGSTVSEGYRHVGYGDLPRTNYFTPAADRIVPVDLRLPNRRKVGYLPGTGDAVAESLLAINFNPVVLSIADLTAATLAQYDTVILGVRTYAAHPDLHGAPTQALLDFARNGGNVIVQYQTPPDFTSADAPYPLDLGSNEKVVDETAPVTLLNPTSPVLTTPNTITSADFNNWVEERGHGFMATWDPHYTALTETHDPGVPAEDVAPQAPQRGGLLTTPLGKGHWTYCAFALYRQLPEAVPGAFRLLANLLDQ